MKLMIQIYFGKAGNFPQPVKRLKSEQELETPVDLLTITRNSCLLCKKKSWQGENYYYKIQTWRKLSEGYQVIR